MYYYIFLTHGELGKTLLSTAGNIMDEDVSESCSVYSMDFSMVSELDNIKEEIKQVIEKISSLGRKIIIFVDIFGGSPSNVAFTMPKQDNLDVVSGVNLAMVMYAVEHINSDKDIQSMVSGIIRTGSQNITSARQLLGNNTKKDKG
jgi:mannose PTS system EIIA component